MKKVRLTSLCLAFVMVVALMVPALSVMATADAAAAALPSGAPATLPTLNTAEWTAHAAYSNAYPGGVSLDGKLIGKNYTVSSNLLAAPLTPAIGTAEAVTLSAAAGAANANIAGLLLKIKVGGSGNYHNNGIGIHFQSNGHSYSVTGSDGDKDYNAHQAYIYDTKKLGEDWLYVRDTNKGSNGTKAGRVPNGFDGYMFVALDEMGRYLDDATYPNIHTNVTIHQDVNVGADLIAAGISNMALGAFWGHETTFDGVYYVYVDGYNSQATNTLPGAIVPFVDQLNYTENGAKYSVTPSTGAVKNTTAALGTINASFTKTNVAKGAEVATVAGFDNAGWFTVSAESNFAALDGFMFNITNTSGGNGGNNPVVIAVEVDGVPYFAISDIQRSGVGISSEEYTGHEVYFRWNGSSKWFETSGRHYTLGGRDTYAYDRAFRIPYNFAGDIYVPVEHFVKSYKTIASYTAERSNYDRLTQAVLDSANEIKVFVGQIWGMKGVDLANASLDLVYADNSAATMPTQLPAKANVLTRSTMRYDNKASIGTLINQTIDDSRAWNGINAMVDAMWGAKISTTVVSSTGTVAEQNLTVNDLTAALAGKDIRDLAGVMIRAEALDSTGDNWNAGYNLRMVGADGYTYGSGTMGNGNNHAFLYAGGDGWFVESFNGSIRIPLGYSGYSFIPVTTFGGAVSGGGGANKPIDGLFLSEQLNGLKAYAGNGNAFTSLTFEHAWGKGTNLLAIYFVWVDGLGDAMDAARVPTKLPVNSETPVYALADLYNIANNGTNNIDGFYGNWQVNPALPTMAAAANPKALASAFEGKSIVATSLVSNAEILAQGTNGHNNKFIKVWDGYGVGYTAGTGQNAGQELNFAVPANKQAVTQNAAGILLRVDNTNANQASNVQGTGFNFRVTLGNGTIYSMFTHTGYNADGAFESWPATKKAAYIYESLSGTWFAQSDTSKLRIVSGFDGYVFIPFSTLGLESMGAETLFDMEEAMKYGISTVTIQGYWGGDLMVKSIELASVEVADSAYSMSAAPFLGDDISLGIKVDSAFNPYNLDVTMTVEQEGREAVELTADNGIFVYEDIKAQNMTDNITVTMKIAGETVKVINNYSIKAYAQTLLASDASAEAKALVEAMLQYGAAAQVVAGYKTNDLATEIKDFSATTIAGNLNVSGVATIKVSASLDQDINLTIKGLTGTVTATIGDRTFAVQTPVAGTVVLEGILADELDETITLYVDDVAVKTLSVNAYLAVVAANANNTAESITLAKALYEYGVAAAAYAN